MLGAENRTPPDATTVGLVTSSGVVTSGTSSSARRFVVSPDRNADGGKGKDKGAELQRSLAHPNGLAPDAAFTPALLQLRSLALQRVPTPAARTMLFSGLGFHSRWNPLSGPFALSPSQPSFFILQGNFTRVCADQTSFPAKGLRFVDPRSDVMWMD